MSGYLKQQFRDRDVFHDIDGRVYVTLGYIQPDNRILSYLKYIPSQDGKWKVGQTRYQRMFSGSITSVVEGTQKVPDQYMYKDTYFGANLLEVPKTDVSKYFNPEERLREIVTRGPSDSIEEMIVTLAEAIQTSLDVPLSSLGITGSVAWGAHDPEWSDINMNIYGFDNSWHLYKHHELLDESEPTIRIRRGVDWSSTMAHLKSRVPFLSQEDLTRLYKRRTELILQDQFVTIMPVLLPYEAPIEYGSEQYITMTDSPIDIKMWIDGCDYGIFLPTIYTGYSNPIEELGGIEVTRIMMYDGSFRSMLRDGDRVQIFGTVQRVVTPNSANRSPFYQIMVGTKSGIGKEYIRLIE